MATAITMITRAMRLARIIGKGETPDSDEASDGLEALNAMLDSWSTERLFVYAIRDESFTWAAAAQSRTVGSGGDFSTDRPVRVDQSSYFTVNGVDFQIGLLESDSYSSIAVKNQQATVPEWLYVDYTSSALVTIYAYPVPQGSSTFHLRTWRLLQSFSALTDTFALPAGYKRAIEFSLAEEIASEYGKTIDPDVKRIASKARANIKRINTPLKVMPSEIGYLNIARTGDVYADQP